MTVRYKALDGTDDWMELKDEAFNVDRKSPYIEFDGGFVSNPSLSNVMGYMNPVAREARGQDVRRRHRVSCSSTTGRGTIADLDCDGILNPNERQFDPCRIRQHVDGSGHAAAWTAGSRPTGASSTTSGGSIRRTTSRRTTTRTTSTTSRSGRCCTRGRRTSSSRGSCMSGARITLDEYNPADTLVVPMPVIGGGVIQDNDIIEITWYSDKSIEQNSDGPGFGCIVDTVYVDGTMRLFWDPRLRVRRRVPGDAHLQRGHPGLGVQQRQQVRRAAVHRGHELPDDHIRRARDC